MKGIAFSWYRELDGYSLYLLTPRYIAWLQTSRIEECNRGIVLDCVDLFTFISRSFRFRRCFGIALFDEQLTRHLIQRFERLGDSTPGEILPSRASPGNTVAHTIVVRLLMPFLFLQF